jgi:mannose-6-phosphate isomerase-like protein (cupin superfamily)
MVIKPYAELNWDNFIYRKFASDVDDEILTWHQDEKDRKVFVVRAKNWYIQFDNKLPVPLKEGNYYFIPKNTWHRVIKGQSELNLLIEEK